MKSKVYLLFLGAMFILSSYFLSPSYAQAPTEALILYDNVVYDLSLLSADYKPEFLKYVIDAIDYRLAKQFKKMVDPRVHGVKIVSDYYVTNGVELRKTPDQKFVLFISELRLDDSRNIVRAVMGLEELTESQKREMHVQKKRMEHLNAILDGDSGFSDSKDEENWVGDVLKSRSGFFSGIVAWLDDMTGKYNVLIKDYHQGFDAIFPKELIVPYSRRQKKEQDQVIALLNEGDHFFLLRNFESALESYKKAIWVNPQHCEAYSRRALLYVEMGMYEQAYADFNMVLNLDGKDPVHYNNRGDFYLILGEFELAVIDYTQAIEIDPNYGKAYFNRGCAQDERNLYLEAVEDYSKAIEIIPDFVESYSNRGYVYFMLKDYQKAERDFSQAIFIDENFGEAYVNRALVYYFQAEYKKSWMDVIKCEELGLTMNPQFLVTLQKAYPRP